MNNGRLFVVDRARAARRNAVIARLSALVYKPNNAREREVKEQRRSAVDRHVQREYRRVLHGKYRHHYGHDYHHDFHARSYAAFGVYLSRALLLEHGQKLRRYRQKYYKYRQYQITVCAALGLVAQQLAHDLFVHVAVKCLCLLVGRELARACVFIIVNALDKRVPRQYGLIAPRHVGRPNVFNPQE